MVKSDPTRLDLIFHALSDSTRRSILRDLTKKEKTVTQLAKPYKMSLAAVSKHLKVLEAADLIERRKEGSFQVVSLNFESLKTAGQWINYYERENLQRFLERG